MQKQRIIKIIFTTLLLCVAGYLPAQEEQINDPFYRINDLKQQLLVTEDNLQKDSLLQQLMDAYIWNNSDSALYYAQQKILLAKKLESQELEAYATGYYGYILGLLGNYPQAIAYLLKGLHMAEEANDPSRLDFFYDALSNTYIEQGNFDRALYYANQFKNISIRNSDTLQYGWLLTKGVLYEKFNQPDSALAYMQKVLAFELRESGAITRGRTALILGNIYRKKRNFPLALHYYHLAVANAIENVHYINLADAFNGMARLYFHTGRLDSGIYYARAALDLSRSTSYSLGQLASYTNLSDLYKRQGISDSTIKYLEATITLKDSLFNQQKEREVQSLVFGEQLRQQELLAEQQRFRNRMRLYALGSGLLVLFVIAGILYRNNRSKQKAYAQLQKQKAETDRQKAKAEQALEELKTAQAQLIQREKMASLGELTAGIAHEIQNPLNFVNNFSEVSVELTGELKEEVDKLPVPEKDKQAMLLVIDDILQNQQRINHHGKRADAIVKGMLQHSRNTPGRKEATDINLLTDEYLRLSYHGFMAKDKTFDAVLNTHFDTTIGKVPVVPQDMGKVLLNLFNNAFYYVTEKKKQLNSMYKPAVSVSTKKQNGKVEITVRDNGTGIPEKIIDKIYQPFFTTKPTGEGTGLGLSLSYDIITKGHGGEINVETKEGEYTQFTVVLPV